ncbi:MAG TPA: helix-turn-helix transcriptional regulator [bacterium]|nr:helix-turn-helix transcriptional regulator [bacterium]
MPVEFINLVILLAAAQGIFLAALIFHKHRALFANRFLGMLILLYSLILLHLLFTELNYYQTYNIIPAVIGIAFFMIPLHYLYAKYLVRNALSFQKSDWWHFLPVLLWELSWGIILLSGKNTRTVREVFIGSEGARHGAVIFNWVILVQTVVYMTATIRLLNRYAREIKDVFSSIGKIRLDWLRYMTYTALGLVAVFLLENLLLIAGINLSGDFNLSSLLVAIYVYTIGYLGLLKSEVFTVPAVAGSLRQLPELRTVHRQTPGEGANIAEKYEKSGLTADRARKYQTRLLTLMEEQQPFTDPDLTLNRLAELLAISPHNLSEVINTRLHQNFFDFVNGYRLEQAKRDLADPDKTHLKILAIAYDAGFNSKSSFYSLFKKHIGMTPSEFRGEASE